jgi:enoyl-CoA hydratase/carnithine racemase
MAYTELLYSVLDGVATVTLHRPDKLNAFTNTMMRTTMFALS